MKNTLVAIIVFAIIVMPYTYFYMPALNDSDNMRQEIANLKASISRFDNGRDKIYEELLKSQKENLEKERKTLNFLLPDFSVARTNLMAPFNLLRNEIPGDWSVVPEGQFQTSDKLVFWPFKISFRGTGAEAIKLLAYLEMNDQFMRFENFEIVTDSKDDNLVSLTGKVELVFQETPLKGGQK